MLDEVARKRAAHQRERTEVARRAQELAAASASAPRGRSKHRPPT